MRVWKHSRICLLFAAAILGGASACNFKQSNSSKGASSGAAPEAAPALGGGVGPGVDILAICPGPLLPHVLVPVSALTMTRHSSFELSGTCAPSSIISLSGAIEPSQVTGGSLSRTCTPAGTFQFDITKPDDGLFPIDLEGQCSSSRSAKISRTFQVDRVAPIPLVLATPPTLNFTNSLSQVDVSGTCEIGSTVQATGAASAQTTCSAAGNFSIAIQKNIDATYVFQVLQTDSAGNDSPSATIQWTRDTLPPDAPALPITHFVNHTSPLTVTGSCTPGLNLQLSGDSSSSSLCPPSGSFSLSIPKALDGSYDFSLLQADDAANLSPSVAIHWNLDRVPPPAPGLLTPAISPYNSGETNFTLSASCEAGAQVNLEEPGVGTSAAPCDPITLRAHFPITKNVDATYNYQLTQTDAAANRSAVTGFQWVRDTTLPPTPTILSPAQTPHFSSSSQLTISGSCEGGHTVRMDGISSSDVLTPAGTLEQGCPAGTFSFSIQRLTDGTSTVQLTQFNASLIESLPTSLVWIRDTSAPDSVQVLSPAGGSSTSSGNLELGGTCEAGTTVSLAGSSSQSTACVPDPLLPPAIGKFHFTVIKPIDGVYPFTLVQSDLAGNSSVPSAFTWTRSTPVPATPTITSPALPALISNASLLTIIGTCTTGLTVQLSGVAAGAIVNPAGSLSQTCSAGTFRFDIQQLTDDSLHLNVLQTQSGVNSGVASLVWTRDATPPETTISVTPSSPNFASNASFSFSSADPTALLQCSLNGQPFNSCVSPQVVSPPNGPATFAVRAVDPAGNVDPTPATFSWNQQVFSTLALYNFTAGLQKLADSSLFLAPSNNPLTEVNAPAGGFATADNAAFGTSLNLIAGANTGLEAVDQPALELGRSQFTIDFRLALNALVAGSNTYVTVLSKTTGAAGGLSWEVLLRKINSGTGYRLVFRSSINGTSTIETSTSTCNSSVTSAHHYAVTWNQGTVRLYCDGTLKTTKVASPAGSTLFDSAAPLRLGFRPLHGTVQPLSGKLDQVRISQGIRYGATNFVPPAAPYVAD